ncbi:MAG: hypothetical protein EA383_13505 [Spirochaetaceae bacterium]|nr:MAG: hypothetical protein EA383_13505 [Spirochaetaceae bacterium]
MSSAAGAAGGAAGATAAVEASRQAGVRRKAEGDKMSIWVVNQEKDKLILAIGFRAKRSRLQAQSLGTGSWETIGRFADDTECERVLRDITMRIADKSVRKVEIPAQ